MTRAGRQHGTRWLLALVLGVAALSCGTDDAADDRIDDTAEADAERDAAADATTERDDDGASTEGSSSTGVDLDRADAEAVSLAFVRLVLDGDDPTALVAEDGDAVLRDQADQLVAIVDGAPVDLSPGDITSYGFDPSASPACGEIGAGQLGCAVVLGGTPMMVLVELRDLGADGLAVDGLSYEIPGGVVDGTAPVSPVQRFVSPSGNIVCAIDTDHATCQILDHAFQPPARPDECASAWGDQLTVDRSGAGFACHDADLRPDAPVLAYGDRAASGDVECHSAPTGMTCRHRPSGHGFTLRRAAYETF